jgi:hypothetical protein
MMPAWFSCELPERGSHGRRDVGIKKDAVRHLNA